MIPTEFLKGYVTREIKFIEDRGVLLDIFYRILKADGGSYLQARKAWIEWDRRQLHLFEKK